MDTEKLYRGKRIVEDKDMVSSDISLIDYLLSQDGRDVFVFTSKVDGERMLNLTREDLERIKESREETFGTLEHEFLSL